MVNRKEKRSNNKTLVAPPLSPISSVNMEIVGNLLKDDKRMKSLTYVLKQCSAKGNTVATSVLRIIEAVAVNGRISEFETATVALIVLAPNKYLPEAIASKKNTIIVPANGLIQ